MTDELGTEVRRRLAPLSAEMDPERRASSTLFKNPDGSVLDGSRPIQFYMDPERCVRSINSFQDSLAD